MITGAHLIIYSVNPEADRQFFLNVLKFPSIDIGHGWLIFKLPASEMAIHPAEENGNHELYFMCDDINVFIQEMNELKVTCSPVENQRWGNLTYLQLPGEGKIGVYEPKHLSP